MLWLLQSKDLHQSASKAALRLTFLCVVNAVVSSGRAFVCVYSLTLSPKCKSISLRGHPSAGRLFTLLCNWEELTALLERALCCSLLVFCLLSLSTSRTSIQEGSSCCERLCCSVSLSASSQWKTATKALGGGGYLSFSGCSWKEPSI